MWESHKALDIFHTSVVRKVPNEPIQFNSSQVVIPVTLCIVIITVYIMLGALMFNSWEGWDLISSAYFCFITLTTVSSSS